MHVRCDFTLWLKNEWQTCHCKTQLEHKEKCIIHTDTLLSWSHECQAGGRVVLQCFINLWHQFDRTVSVGNHRLSGIISLASNCHNNDTHYPDWFWIIHEKFSPPNLLMWWLYFFFWWAILTAIDVPMSLIPGCCRNVFTKSQPTGPLSRNLQQFTEHEHSFQAAECANTLTSHIAWR